MAYQTCTPSDCYGPIQQHVFLGASLISFNASAGWNEQQSELTVELVEDTCGSGNKIYFDSNLVLQSGQFADPGFIGRTQDIVGRPVYFGFVTSGTTPDFEFAGIIQSWTSSDSAAGREIISVKITSPGEILGSAQVITDNYAGATSSIPNVFNVFGYYEGSTCSTFGASQQNQKGMPWSRIKQGVEILTSAIPTPAAVLSYSNNGRLQFRAGLSNGYGLIPEDYTGYFVDLSEIPDGPDYYRIAGTSNNLQQVISQVLTDFGYDYYTELIPVALSGSILKIIKVRCVNRNTQPSLSAIRQFVAYNGVSGCGVVEKSSGTELRTELTNTFVLGGRKQQMYWVENYSGNWNLSDDLIEPYWGLDVNGNVIHSAIGSGDIIEFTGNTLELSYSLQAISGFPATIKITEPEIQTASAGFDAWASYISSAQTATYKAITGVGVIWGGVYDLAHLANLLAAANKRDSIRGTDLVKLSNEVITDEQMDDIQRIYQYFATLAQDYYGRRYTIRIPEVCAYLDGTTNELVFSREISNGGWNETNGSEYTNLIGINTTSLAADFFRNQDGTFGPFVRYNNITGIDFSALSPDQYGAVSGAFDDGSGSEIVGALWVKTQTDPYFVFGNASAFTDPRAIITVPQPVVQKTPEGNPDKLFGAYALIINGIQRVAAGNGNPTEILNDLKSNFGSATFAAAAYPKAVQPSASTIALQNNQEIYGPWFAGTLGAVGTTEVREDDSLVPWNFGGMTLMNTAGQAIADQGITNMQVSEMGHIKVVGLPRVSLGAELLTYAAQGYIAGQKYFPTRVATSQSVGGVNYFTVDILSGGYWAGTYGPNVTNINIDVSANGGITTTYNLKTFTPIFGRFAKYNAERLKEIGSIRQKIYLGNRR